MIKIGIEELSTTFTGLLLKYGICHVIFILEISLLNMFLPFVTKKVPLILKGLKTIFIGEAVFGLPKWLGIVIAGLMFYLVFFIRSLYFCDTTCIYYLWCLFCICVSGYCTMHGALWCLQGYRYHSVDFGDFMDTSAWYMVSQICHK